MTPRTLPRTLPVTLAIVVLVAAVPPGAAQESSMSQQAFESTLASMQEHVEEAADRYEAGDRTAALEAARSVEGHFTYNGSGASPLERKIKEESALAIGDRVKANAARLVSAIEQRRSAEEVREIADSLAPSLNRLVLVAQGKTVAASQRSLRSPEAIDDAVADVTAHVDEALRLYGQEEDRDAALEAAKEAFFTFETNGLGPDTSTVDDDLENEAENLIVNFDEATAETNPGLSQLIERDAPLDDLEAQADRIARALGEVADLLKATLPPVNLGDANGDGGVTIVDALLVAQAALGIRQDAPEMDANQDGRVSIVDALYVAQAALGIRNL